jgi:hypothetical protein
VIAVGRQLRPSSLVGCDFLVLKPGVKLRYSRAAVLEIFCDSPAPILRQYPQCILERLAHSLFTAMAGGDYGFWVGLVRGGLAPSFGRGCHQLFGHNALAVTFQIALERIRSLFMVICPFFKKMSKLRLADEYFHRPAAAFGVLPRHACEIT